MGKKKGSKKCCPHCNKLFSPSYINAHIRNVHGREPPRSTKAPGRSRIKASPGGETFYVVRRKDGTFKDWVKISRSIAQDALRKAETVPSRSGRGHQGDYPKRKTT
ncbi:hypothetical protein H8E65_01640 [Candidatus Bathyarchaeota archaeon]|nr:hypothetical protein [Candidatus Bathyarchaeota archaeon]